MTRKKDADGWVEYDQPFTTIVISGNHTVRCGPVSITHVRPNGKPNKARFMASDRPGVILEPGMLRVVPPIPRHP